MTVKLQDPDPSVFAPFGAFLEHLGFGGLQQLALRVGQLGVNNA